MVGTIEDLKEILDMYENNSKVSVVITDGSISGEGDKEEYKVKSTCIRDIESIKFNKSNNTLLINVSLSDESGYKLPDINKVYSLSRKINSDKNLSIEEKYNLLFSDKIYYSLPFVFPDEDEWSYEESVKSLMNSFDSYMSKYKKVYLDYTNEINNL